MEIKIRAKNQSIDEFIINKKQKKIHDFSMQVQTLKVLADMYKETKTGQAAKSVITPVAHNPLLTDAAVPETAASDQIRNELLNLQFSA